MSQNSEEVPHRDRKKTDARFSVVGESERAKCQENFDVGYGYGLNVKKPKLDKRGGS